jgi:hypothetical protein
LPCSRPRRGGSGFTGGQSQPSAPPPVRTFLATRSELGPSIRRRRVTARGIGRRAAGASGDPPPGPCGPRCVNGRGPLPGEWARLGARDRFVDLIDTTYRCTSARQAADAASSTPTMTGPTPTAGGRRPTTSMCGVCRCLRSACCARTTRASGWTSRVSACGGAHWPVTDSSGVDSIRAALLHRGAETRPQQPARGCLRRERVSARTQARTWRGEQAGRSRARSRRGRHGRAASMNTAVKVCTHR